MNGEWKWEATYNGETVSHSFNITGALSIEEVSLEETSIYPNPFSGIVNINSKIKIKKASVVDILGKTILIQTENSTNGIKELNLEELSGGIKCRCYYLALFAAFFALHKVNGLFPYSLQNSNFPFFLYKNHIE